MSNGNTRMWQMTLVYLQGIVMQTTIKYQGLPITNRAFKNIVPFKSRLWFIND